MTIEEFHERHGAKWARIINLPSFNDGLIFVSLQHTQRLLNLTDAEITTNAVMILSEIRGRLRMQAEIMALPTLEEPTQEAPLTEEYPNSEEEAWAEMQRQKNLSSKPV